MLRESQWTLSSFPQGHFVTSFQGHITDNLMGNYKSVLNEPINPNLFLQRYRYKFLQIALIIKHHYKFKRQQNSPIREMNVCIINETHVPQLDTIEKAKQ